ncbi:MAG TPA: hypothetical protein EYP34_04000, partial [Chromatiaceae bacterium]|nr:hypothetical protein [Chromatiaceae bacterium]
MPAKKSSTILRSLYKASRPILKVPHMGMLGFLCLMLLASTLNAATPDFSAANGPTLLPGSPADNTVGAKYIYQNVETSVDGIPVDAVVTIADIQNAFIWTSTVEEVLDTDARFEPGVDTTAPGGYVEYQVEFVQAGTVTQASDAGVRANLGSFVMEAIDVDGEEFFEAVVTSSYTLQNPTELTVISPSPAGGEFTRFQSGTNNQAGIGTSPDWVVRINYENVDVIRFRYGSAIDSNNRYNSVGFAGEITFTSPVTTSVNTPPTVAIQNAPATVNSTAPYPVNFQFSENVTGFTLSDIVVGNGTASNLTGSGSTYTASITPSGTGNITIDVPTVAVQDDVGAGNSAATQVVTILDTDGDGVADLQDLDSDNDGILDSVESSPTVGNATGAGQHKENIYWVNWGSAFNDGFQPGDSETLTLPDGSQVTLSVTAANGDAGQLIPSDMQTWPGAQLANAYNTPGTSEVMYSSVFNLNPQVTFSITAVDANGNPFSPDIIASDGETSDTGESQVITTDGTNWTEIESTGTAGYALTRQSPNQIAFTNTENGVPILLSKGVSQLIWEMKPENPAFGGNGGKQGMAMGFYLKKDSDSDGLPDEMDPDSDNDGISDLIESGQDQAVVDTDNDGRHDGGVDANGVPLAAGGGVTPPNSDGDGVTDQLDLDADNDGIPDAVEAQPTATYTAPTNNTLFIPVDTDNDGTSDYLDTDSDNDAKLDSAESGLTPGADNNGDGIGDGIGASYSDPDGIVNDPSADLAN